MQIKMMQTLIKDCQRLPKIKEMFEASTKIINNYLAAHQQNVFQLGTYYNMFGTKQNTVKEPKSIILMISVWQTRYRSKTFEDEKFTN